MKNSDVIVVGGGAIGISCVYYLWKNGLDVRVIERDDICSGCSYGNAGLIACSHIVPLASPGIISKGLRWLLNPASPFYIKPSMNLELLSWLWKFRKACKKKYMVKSIPVLNELCQTSSSLFDELKLSNEFDFMLDKKGLLLLCKTDKGLIEESEAVRLAKEMNVQADILTEEGIRELDPNLNVDVAGGVFYPDDSHIDPFLFIKKLSGFLESNGVKIQSQTRVKGFQKNGRTIKSVLTDQGDFAAKEIILAGGVWNKEILESLDLKLHLQPGKGYSYTIENVDRLPSVPMILLEARIVITPMANKLRFGGTMELGEYELKINSRRVTAITKAINECIPGLINQKVDYSNFWSGLRPCTPDGLPFIGRHEQFDNLSITTGHAMLGITLAPITGKLISEIILDQKSTIDLTRLRIERFD